MSDNEPLIRLGFFLMAFLSLAFLEWRTPRRTLTIEIYPLVYQPVRSDTQYRPYPHGVSDLALRHCHDDPEISCGSIESFFSSSMASHSSWHGYLRLYPLSSARYVSFPSGSLADSMMHHTDLDFDITAGVRFHPSK